MLGGYYPLCKLIQSGALKNSRKLIARKKLENLFVIVTVRRHDRHEIINKNRGISFSIFFSPFLNDITPQLDDYNTIT